MKGHFGIMTLLLLGPVAYGQEFFTYEHPAKIESELVAEGQYERAAQRYAHLGEHQKAMALYDRAFPTDEAWKQRTRLPRILTEAELAHFRTFRPVDAFDYLAEKARRRQIVMLNETHHHVQHRAFVRQLLAPFYRAGYRYLGLEALSQYDSLLNERGYPTLKSGYYLREPQMANLVRDALAMGFEVFAYEATERETERDLEQAQNIQKILDKDPEARMLVLCGFHHLTEPPVDPSTNRGKTRWMAGWVKERTGIDPFTVNQAVLSEWGTPEMAAPYYREIFENGPTLFVNDEGDLFNGPEGTDLFDALLYHPPTSYVSNRPRWLLWDKQARLYEPDQSAITIRYPVMLRAYRQEEMTESLLVPVDILLLDDPADESALVLRPGRYVLVVENAAGDSQQLEISVK